MADLEIDLGGGAMLRSLRPDDGEVLADLIEANRVRLGRWFAWADTAGDAAQQAAWIEDRREDTGELGFWLDEGAIGRGLITRAGQALLTEGFETFGLHRIQLRAGVENLRSRAVAKRLKMREEGVLRGAGKVGGGRYVDLVMYGLIDEDWRLTR
jgi:RimJ/RimL family protein N-acetyltransferase